MWTLPGGTAAFLVSDIEDSRPIVVAGDANAHRLGDHQRLMRDSAAEATHPRG
jgi:hypothetical protein